MKAPIPTLFQALIEAFRRIADSEAGEFLSVRRKSQLLKSGKYSD